MYSPFGMNTARRQAGLYSSPYQPQNQQQSPYDFKGLENRLGQIETGIAGLTEQFGNFKMPGQETVDPEYTGNAAPDPLTTAAPTGGIQSLPTPQNEGFNFDPSGGSLMSQLSSAYGGQTHNEQMGRGPAGFTQGFADFFTGEGYYADPRGTYADGPWSISDKPIDVGTRGGGVLNPYGYSGSFTGNLEEFNPINKPTSQPGRPNPLLQGPINDIANTGYVPEPYTGGDRGLAMQAGMNLPGAGGRRPNDLMQPIGGLTQPQQQQALQVGLGALQGPTQQKIQQGLGALV